MLLRRPRTRNVMAWGLAYVLFGASRVFANVQAILDPGQTVPPTHLLWGTVVPHFALASVAAFLLVEVARGQTQAARRTLGLLSAAWALLLVVLGVRYHLDRFLGLPAGTSEFEASVDSFYFASNYLVALAYGMLWIGLLEALRQGLARSRAQLLVAFALMPMLLTESIFALDLPLVVVTGFPLDAWVLAACVLGALALVPLAWCFRLFGGPSSRFVLALFLGLVLSAIAWRLSFTALAFSAHASTLAGVAVGVIRILSLVVAGYAILRTDFLPTKLAATTARRGSLAGLALAALFITAQVLQNVLGDRLGLLWGGVVAGTVVFAALPLQRAAERRLGSGEKAVETFRAAVRIALRDRKITPAEERELVLLAHELGVAPDRAYAIIAQES